ncbi:RNA methyltransferase, RsmD family [Campylobacter iguaniorum]|uniref:RNA methyltransferase, RsmD family n=1 Tax=Campylobacter iguaniorum TaxID=1244531 RepID=A0A076F844_9BACT|nr:16S rRNA (guanine(966)-N(2))-methyltransferase RsmD [Campylobacter iguaniorum]AII14370.1 RNA methyltransferase, RsmD family [Campylobacter iguaniorum]
MKNNTLFTTISSGKFKGKKVFLPSLETTRSTKNIVKNSFFNTIQNEIYGKTFIEVFGGSALMAMEALSNGASKTYAIEIDKNAYNLTKKNVSSLNCDDIKSINADTFKATPKIIKENSDIILYIDPPFDIRDGFNDIYDRVWDMLRNSKSSDIYLVVMEHISSYAAPEAKFGYTKFKSRTFGKTTLSYYQLEQ